MMLRLKPLYRRPAKPRKRKSAPGGRWTSSRMKGPLRAALRLALAVLLFFWILDIWNIDLPVGETVVKTLIEILVVVLICYVAWGLINAAILRRMRAEMPEEESDDEKEEGGAGGSRIGTLLLLLRKFLLVVIIVMAVLIVLSALGVHIGPLIAGAGVFGLAIGFGAQTLVKDIISGVFFLMDDAFRVGDYLEVSRHQGNGGAHFAAFPQAAQPAGPGLFHPVRRYEDGDQPQPRLRHHEARLPGALRCRCRKNTQDHQEKSLPAHHRMTPSWGPSCWSRSSPRACGRWMTRP